jgi:hypothetical protein
VWRDADKKQKDGGPTQKVWKEITFIEKAKIKSRNKIILGFKRTGLGGGTKRLLSSIFSFKVYDLNCYNNAIYILSQIYIPSISNTDNLYINSKLS